MQGDELAIIISRNDNFPTFKTIATLFFFFFSLLVFYLPYYRKSPCRSLFFHKEKIENIQKGISEKNKAQQKGIGL